MKFDEVSIYWIRDLKKIKAHYAYQSLSVGYIPGQRDIRPVISRGRGQCLNGAEEVPRANFQGGTKHCMASPKGCNGSYIPLAMDTTNLYYA